MNTRTYPIIYFRIFCSLCLFFISCQKHEDDQNNMSIPLSYFILEDPVTYRIDSFSATEMEIYGGQTNKLLIKT